MKAIIGLDIGGTKVLGALFDLEGNVVSRVKKKTKSNEGIEMVMKQVSKVIDGLLKLENIELLGIGVGVPGLVSEDGVVRFSPNIPFKEFMLENVISEMYRVPVVVGNDVNVAMFGEYKHLNQQKLSNVLGVFVGTGVGGAIILDGNLFIGQGSAAEFGHMVVNVDGAYCGCGAQGCLEAYASKTAMQKYIIKQLGKGRTSVLEGYLEEDGPILKSSSLKKALQAGDELALDVVERTAKYLGVAIGNLVNLFHPQMIILGGGVIESLEGELIERAIREARLHAMPGMMDSVKIENSTLGDEAGVYGAYRLVLDKIKI